MRREPSPIVTAIVTVVLALGSAAANLQVSLRTGYSFPMAPIAALLAGVLFRGRDAKTRAAIVGVAAGASAAGYVPGGGNVPALVSLAASGLPLPSPLVWGAWLVLVSLLGLVFARWLAGPLVRARDALAFPTAKATADITGALTDPARDDSARSKLRSLLLGASGGVVVAILQAVRIVPPRVALPGRLGLEVSALALGIGPYIGPRVAASMALGGLISTLVLGPRAAAAGIIPDATYANVVRFAVWPALAMVATSAILAWALDVRASRKARPAQSASAGLVVRLVLASLVIAVALRVVFDVGWLAALATGPLAVVTTLASIRAMGETDAVPVKALAPLTQIFAGVLAPGSLGAAITMPNVSCAAGLSAADTATSLRANDLVDERPRALDEVTQPSLAILGMRALGIVAGALVTVVCLPWLVPAPRSFAPTDALPAPSIVIWKSTSEVFSGGLAALDASTRVALVAGGLVGVALVVLERALPAGRRAWVPSAVGLGGALVLPPSIALTIFAGAVLGQLAKRRFSAELVGLVGASAVAGESVASVVTSFFHR